LEAIIDVRGLFKRYGDVEALRGLNLRMRKGIFGFIGPNGSGKTTTIKILLGALRPDAGEAYVLGHDCFKESLEIRRRVGVLHENPSYPKNMTGLEYLTFVGSLYGLGKEEAKSRARELLKSLDLEEAADRSIGGYSAGMRQRLGLAQALIGNPRLAILDEPTANLDPLGRAELLEMIKTLHKDQGMSFLIASHILPELQKICDQIGIISNGVMLEQGTIAELTKKYMENTFKVKVSNPHILIEELRKAEFVEEVSMRGDNIWIKANEPEKLYNQISKIIQDKKLKLLLFEQPQLDLEDLFRSLLGEK